MTAPLRIANASGFYGDRGSALHEQLTGGEIDVLIEGRDLTDPAVLNGQAVIAGTRVPVSVVLDCLAAGMSSEQIVAEYPTLTAEGVQAAAAYGALLAREELVPVTPAE